MSVIRRNSFWKERSGSLVSGSKEELEEDEYAALKTQIEDKESFRRISLGTWDWNQPEKCPQRLKT